ncbi:MAG TPA: DUF1080 domain-containing protein [Planctomycetaceae bacterium]|nr:DUF1080 domain-containing protein [Planctomycetaceae bacterium]HIQ21233.1 DUF1080 domain-containing protein [Planctomycetota bacterium]
MRRLSCLLIAVVTCVVAITTSVSGAAEKGQWRSLFDGKTLNGWEKHGGRAKYWVEDGAIVGQSVPNSPNTFLCTKERFRDFELVFEVKVDNQLNSGVQIRSNIKENDRVYGPQVEIEASPGQAGYIYGEATGRGWLSKKRDTHSALKNGQWNRYRVLARGPNIKTWINDTPIADLTDEEASREGFIGLQVHGVGKREEPLYVRWRNIKIRPLK